MKKIILSALPLLMLMVLFSNCRKKASDEYYGRPETLEPPIYQVLTAKGNFKHMLAAIDKAGHKSSLGAAGYWTLFAPHDSAFQVYFASRGISSVDQLDSVACREIVTYCLVYNAFRKERLGDYQAATGWQPGLAFKRRTANYTYIYDEKNNSGNTIKAIASNRNNAGAATYYVEADMNNKYIPYFLDVYMTKANITAADYNYFYPSTPYTGFNVVDAIVTEQDIAAENGVIHVVNKVITSLPSIDQYIGTKPEYSLFKSLFDKYLVQYLLNPSVTTTYQNRTGSNQQVFTKVYNSALAFSLNNENYLAAGNIGQTEGYSIFVPTNTVLQNYINTVLLEHYPAGSTLDVFGQGSSIINDFMNAHLWQRTVWPSKFGSTLNFLGEEARFDPIADVVDKKILSNGIFYGANKVQEANVFTSVYGRAYLDPKYSMMLRLLNIELRTQVTDIGRNYTMFMISNDMFNAAGYTIDETISTDINQQFRYTPPPGSLNTVATTGATTRNDLLRILNLHVVPITVLNSVSGEGALKTYGEEYIGYKNNKVFGSGNIDANNEATILSTKTSRNGRVYYIDRMLDFSRNTVGSHIEKLGTPTTSQYNYFWEFLRNSTTLWNATTKEILGVANGSFYTAFIPNNAAIMNAVRAGVLPGNTTTGVPTFNPTTIPDQAKVTNFVQYCFLDKRILSADGIESGSINTVLKKSNGDPAVIFVNNTPGSITLTDMESRTARVISAPSTYLSNRAVIHLIDNYLKYTL